MKCIDAFSFTYKGIEVRARRGEPHNNWETLLFYYNIGKAKDPITLNEAFDIVLHSDYLGFKNEQKMEGRLIQITYTEPLEDMIEMACGVIDEALAIIEEQEKEND